jgi:hypothetical protein
MLGITMRTTVSIDPDLARLIEQRMAEQGKGFKQVLNETLRRGFESAVRETPARYEVPTFDSPVLPGIDLAKVNQLLDEESFLVDDEAA